MTTTIDDDIPGTVKQLIVETLQKGHPGAKVTPASLRDDELLGAGGLGIASLPLLHVFVMLEKVYGITFDDASVANAKFNTVGELLRFVTQALAGRTTPAASGRPPA